MTIRLSSNPSDSVDSCINWAKSHATNNLIKPNIVVRMATDHNWILEQGTDKAIMNAGTPGMRIPGILTWTVTENLDSPVHSASMEIANALPVSQTYTTLTAGLAAHYHSTSVATTYYENSIGVTQSYTGGQSLWSKGITDDRLLYREYAAEGLGCADLSQFPDPRVPSDEADTAGTTGYYQTSAGGQGAYFVLIDNEVIKVYGYFGGSTLLIPPGGRGINGVIEAHSAGAVVRLLGFGPFTGKWAGIGYLSTNEARPQRSLLRPGTAFCSYEGYGDFGSSPMTKATWDGKTNASYEFTGYWFVKSHEASIDQEGIPKVSVELVSAAWILQHQQITPTTVVRMKNQLQNYAIWEEGLAGITRNIPGDWVDFHAWEPDRPNSYPLAVKTEYAQHKQFFDHMQETTFGKDCEFCQEDWNLWINSQKGGYTSGDNAVGEARAVGRHIYKESIRVYNGGHGTWEAGPLRTYGKLMIRLAQLSWELPIKGNPLGSKFTKIPQALWDTMCRFENGMVWNGQLSFRLDSETKGKPIPWNWQVQIAQDQPAHYWRDQLMCPFESSYDKQDWFQPLQDLADMNRMTFMFDRRGLPIFIPRGFNLRGISTKYNGTDNIGHWFMGWGGSISSYSYNMDVDSVLTQVWVSGTTAFDSEFSITSGGTTFDVNGNLIWCSPMVGNKEGLVLTSGVQQVDTLSLDNLSLGLSWNTNPAGFSLRLDQTASGGGITQLVKKPAIPRGPLSGTARNSPSDVKNFKRLWNFLYQQGRLNAPSDGNGQFITTVNVDDDWGDDESIMSVHMKKFVKRQTAVSATLRNAVTTDDSWGSAAFKAFNSFFDVDATYIKNDVWWYAINGYDWQYYVGAVTGLVIPQRKDSQASADEPLWIIDQLALRNAITDWQSQFYKQAINVGNSAIDDTVNKATVRTWSTNIADPRVQLGDVVYITIPGYLDSSDDFGENSNVNSPYRNATYVTQISRTMDIQAGTYTASYSGYRFRYQNPYVSLWSANSSNYFTEAGS